MHGFDTKSIHSVRLQRLSALQSTEDNLRGKKEELQPQLVELLRQLAEIERAIEVTHRAVVAIQCEVKEDENMHQPIAVLPTEILSLIFLHVVGFIPGRLEVYPTPLTLSLVCRRWRSVFLGNPKLWTHIQLSHSHSRFFYLEPYLSRSAGLPLEVSFFGPWKRRLPTLLPTLGKEAHRWQRLQMELPLDCFGLPPTPISDSLRHVLSTAMNLQTLYMSVKSSVSGGPGTAIQLPHLQHLAIELHDSLEQRAMVNLLGMISAPALQVLEFTTAGGLDYYLEHDPLFWELALCGKSRYPTVTSMMLCGVIEDTKDVECFMTEFPGITTLTVDLFGLEVCLEFLKNSTMHLPSLQFWAKLETTRVRAASLSGSSRHMLYGWLERRETLGLPSSGLEVDIGEDAVVARWAVRFEKASEGVFKMRKSRVWI